jgi:multimeric flavodoxin WrbA
MKYCILSGSPRKNGNTANLVDAFTLELKKNQEDYEVLWLSDYQINPCTACRQCQKDWSVFGCGLEDDCSILFDKIMACDVLILASPIYSWYCTPPMKALLDRMVYGMNKYYGDEKGPSLWAGKKVGLITTCGYPPEKGADLWEEGMKRYCKHSKLAYIGMLAERHMGYDHPFMDEKKTIAATVFARQLMNMPLLQHKIQPPPR